jgi:mRNA interferase RelE/StbE
LVSCPLCERILKRIEALNDDPKPKGAIKLTNQERYRIRQGVYRILYEIKDLELIVLIVLIVKVAHRKEAY